MENSIIPKDICIIILNYACYYYESWIVVRRVNCLFRTFSNSKDCINRNDYRFFKFAIKNNLTHFFDNWKIVYPDKQTITDVFSNYCLLNINSFRWSSSSKQFSFRIENVKHQVKQLYESSLREKDIDLLNFLYKVKYITKDVFYLGKIIILSKNKNIESFTEFVNSIKLPDFNRYYDTYKHILRSFILEDKLEIIFSFLSIIKKESIYYKHYYDACIDICICYDKYIDFSIIDKKLNNTIYNGIQLLKKMFNCKSIYYERKNT